MVFYLRSVCALEWDGSGLKFQLYHPSSVSLAQVNQPLLASHFLICKVGETTHGFVNLFRVINASNIC